MDDEPRRAFKVDIASCGCPHVHIRFWDADTQVFAIASLPLETAIAVAEDITAEVERLVGATKTPMICQGLH